MLEIPVSWPPQDWTSVRQIYDPGTEIESLFLGLRQRRVGISRLDPEFARVAAFVHYGGAVQGDGHMNLVEEDDFDQILEFAHAGARHFGLGDIADIIAEVTDAVRDGPSVRKGLYSDVLPALEARFYKVELTEQDGRRLMDSLTGAPLEVFRRLWDGQEYGVRTPHWAHTFVWLANYRGPMRQIPHLERRGYLDATAQGILGACSSQ